jgi:hypothetical protein
MTARHWRPVLEVADPGAALDWLAAVPGVKVERARGEAVCGDLRIAVVAPGTRLAGQRAMAVDHLALAAGDVDGLAARLLAAGARWDARFTPDGPREIAAFWQTGVRFAFVRGPGDVALEFCARQGAAGPAKALGLDHIGLRRADLPGAAATLEAEGAAEVARYLLPGTPPVAVRFLREDNILWEVFDEPAPPGMQTTGRWAGVAP